MKVFCDVVTRRSFSRAAIDNQITQSATSQIINQLETHLGVKLLDRFAKTQDDLQLVIDTVQTTVDVMHLMYDDIWTHMQEIEAAGEAAR